MAFSLPVQILLIVNQKGFLFSGRNFIIIVIYCLQHIYNNYLQKLSIITRECRKKAQ